MKVFKEEIMDIDFHGFEMPIFYIYNRASKYVLEVFDLDKETGFCVAKESLEEIAKDVTSNTKMTFIPREDYDPPELIGAWI